MRRCAGRAAHRPPDRGAGTDRKQRSRPALEHRIDRGGLVGCGRLRLPHPPTFPTREIVEALLLGLPTLARVLVLIALASLIWVPIGS
jgi:hypothetical protein